MANGFLLEKMFHHRWWDYSEMPLNIGGYVCPLFSAIWGVACVLIVKLIYPFTDKLVSFSPDMALKISACFIKHCSYS